LFFNGLCGDVDKFGGNLGGEADVVNEEGKLTILDSGGNLFNKR